MSFIQHFLTEPERRASCQHGGIDGKDGLASCPQEALVLVAGKGVSGKHANSELTRFLVVLEEPRA